MVTASAQDEKRRGPNAIQRVLSSKFLAPFTPMAAAARGRPRGTGTSGTECRPEVLVA